MKMRYIVGLFLLLGCTYRSDMFPLEPTPTAPLPAPVVEVIPPVITTTPTPAPQTPAIADTTLPKPRVSQPSGTYFYRTALSFFLGEGTPPEAQVEWSMDNGQTWLINTQITLIRPVILKLRTRLAGKLSPEVTYTYRVKYRRVLIIGNSILINQPIPSQGWAGNWGMAASAADRDFASLLHQHLKTLHNTVEIKRLNAAVFENQFWRFDLAAWQEFRSYQPDLIILRIGDNVEDQRAAVEGFRTYLRDMIYYFLGTPPHQARLLCTSSFYTKEVVNFEMMKALDPPVAATWVPIMHLQRLPGMTAIGLFQDPEIAAHPSDLGMRAIADSIWAGLGPHYK